MNQCIQTSKLNDSDPAQEHSRPATAEEGRKPQPQFISSRRSRRQIHTLKRRIATMAKKRRASTSSAQKASPAAAAMSSSPFPYPSPATPSRSSRFNLPRVHTSRSGVAASTRSQLTVAQLPVLSPPLKKRVTSRRSAKAVKLQLPDDDVDEDENDGRTNCCVHNSDTETEDDEEKLLLIKPDPYLPESYQHRAAVLRHAGSFYDAMLTRARVHNNHSEFIALQALEFDKQFYLWTRAGRVGCAGKTTLTGPFPSAEKVTLEFCTLFASNTNCEWEERHALRYQEGSYTWIELDYSTGTPYSESLTSALADNQGEMDNADSFRDFDLVPTASPPLPMAPSNTRKRRRAGIWTTYSTATSTSTTTATSSTSVRRSLSNQFDWLYAGSDGDTASAASTETSTCACATAPPSRLPTEVQDFLTLVADHTELSYAYTVTDELLGDAIMKLPLGRLSKTTIKRGYETLEEIYEALQSRQVSRARLSNLSSHFYSLIPHHSRLEVIDTMVKLGKKVQLMAEVGASVRGMVHEFVARRCASRNYLDACYDLLECELQPVKSSDPDFALIQTYIRNSNCCGRKQDRLQLLSVFRVEKPEQETRFEPFRTFTNRRILWHGSHLANWLGILSEGLRIAPPEVASNGRTFGKGLYFTDKVTKAQAYCHCRPTNGHNQCVFALSEVALGESKEMLNSDDNAKQFVHTGAGGRAKGAYYHSCKGVGSCRPDSAGEVVDIHGAIWPVGKPVQPEERTGLHHSEYIIYNPSQTRMRYVVLARSPY
ncbi:poly [ADP-ribose] polymerase 2, putative [Phytophthora infestans T30-4]|uniref:Poly [ADP-ribose] polymerase n=1 Tax=Phytophthora infestans (strain T30-4) TaxID=403677 RepID=D0NKQ2_PHYIT|nr:poly [ADP-ribose] polymerase 2, putative [Phytophthora infestans T30-4]EEY60188.1 poly [ADP-ribose] polymerase 2, putative [Phytophthora infestans T30-4]|eukprot:XP_002900395.1 poly [ADP-ribose] polymerase 2, putative [Phytophthora infestans T30-4]